MTWVTVFCTVSAEALGYVTAMEIAGGAMGGYCATGRVATERPPASMITIAITQAKMGLSMKKLTTGAALLEVEPGVAPEATAGVAGVDCSSGFTVAPGLAYCSPSTMTRSPAFRPSVTRHLSPLAR